MRRHLVLAGAGHCHLELLGNLREYFRRGCEVTLISPGSFYYSGMGPGVVSGAYSARNHSVDTGRLVKEAGGAYVQDSVRRIDAARQVVILESGESASYDLLSVNAGSAVPTALIDGANRFGWPVKPIENLTRLRDALVAKATQGDLFRVVIAGGGAAGCEVALNIWHLLKKLDTRVEVQIITPGDRLITREGKRAGKVIRREMERLGIRVTYCRKVVRAEAAQVLLDDDSKIRCDFFVVATGVRPPALFRDSGLPTAADGSLLVNDCLQSVAAGEIFGAGDCIGFKSGPAPRVGVYAVRESKLLHDNLRARLDGKKLRRFQTGKNYLLILNLGDGRGVFLWRGLALTGRWAFRLKDFIDRRFVEKYRPK